MVWSLRAVLVVLMLGSGGVLSLAARADDQVVIAKLMANPSEQQSVLSAAQRSTVVLQNPCPSAQYNIETKYFPYTPPVLDSAGQITSGAWKQVVEGQGCGTKRVLNVLVWAQEAKGLSMMPLLPGASRADLALQKDAVKFVVQALATVPGGREANCKIGYVADTEFLEQENTILPGAKGPSWRELWTMVSCTQKALVPVHFIPDSTGTSISAGPNTAIKVLPLTEGHP
jgi:hypothetical protein